MLCLSIELECPANSDEKGHRSISFKELFMNMCECLHVCSCTMCAPCPRRPEDGTDLLQQELQVVISTVWVPDSEPDPLREQQGL